LWEIGHTWDEPWGQGKKGIKLSEFLRGLSMYFADKLALKSRSTGNLTNPYVFARMISSKETYVDYINKTRKDIKEIRDTLQGLKVSE
jgi:hypothetical protein